jgi:predicted RNA-binding Zn ribbon-like protein
MMEPEQQARPGAPHTVPAQDLRIVGGNLALDLCNSRSGPHDGGIDVDSIVEVDHIVPWAVHAGVLTAEEADQLTASEASASIADATSALTTLLDLREQAHSVFGALAAGGEPEPAEMEGLRQANLVAIARAHQVRLGDHYAFSWPASARTVVIDRVARRMQLPLPRRVEERESTVVQHGRLRARGEDATLRRAPTRTCPERATIRRSPLICTAPLEWASRHNPCGAPREVTERKPLV